MTRISLSRRIALVAGLLALASALSAQTSEWKSYSYPPDGFHVSFPSEPKFETNSVKTDAGPIELHTYTTMVSDTALYVGVSDFGASVSGADPDQVLQRAKNGALSNSESQLVGEKKIFFGSNPGLAYDGEGDSYHISARMAFVGSVLYQIMVVAPKGTPYPDQTRFLDSFALIPRVDSKGKPVTAPAPDWKPYRYPSEGFAAMFPFEPEMQKQSVPNPAGALQLRIYVAQDGATALMAAVCDYGAAAEGKDPDTILDSAQGGALTNANAHLITGKRITMGVNHGVEFESASDQFHFNVRIFLVGTTLYQTLVVAPIKQPYEPTARFLDSFHLIPRTQN
jgi:hypothetical protein